MRAYDDRGQSTEAPPLPGAVVVLADARLFTNLALSVADNAAFVVSLFGRTPREMVNSEARARPRRLEPRAVHRASQPDRRRAAAPAVLGAAPSVQRCGVRPAARASSPERPGVRRPRARPGNGLRARGERHATRWASTFVGPHRLRERAKVTGQKGLIPLAEALAARTGKCESEVMNVCSRPTGLARSGHRARAVRARRGRRNPSTSLAGRTTSSSCASSISSCLPQAIESHTKGQEPHERSRVQGAVRSDARRGQSRALRAGRLVVHTLIAVLAGGHVLVEGAPGSARRCSCAPSGRLGATSSASSSRPT